MTAYTIPEFCEKHGLSRRAYFYQKCRGQAPETIRDGRRDLITDDAATAWRIRHGSAAPDGELVEHIAVGALTALPRLVEQLGCDRGAATYYRNLGTLLEAVGLLGAAAA